MALAPANELATRYAVNRTVVGKSLTDHKVFGLMFAENLIDLKQSKVTSDCCAVLDAGALGTIANSMTIVATSKAAIRTADRCIQVMGDNRVSSDSIDEKMDHEVCTIRIYGVRTQIHNWNCDNGIKRDYSLERSL